MQKRITIFDTVRGFTMISMAGFHACYDLAYLYGWDMPWFTQSVFQDIWRASISWVFLFIAGWMCTLSRNNAKRAAKYAAAALPGSWGIAACLVLFALTWGIPKAVYPLPYLVWLGFPGPGFVSGDYYPLIPFVFMYLTGFFAAQAAQASSLEAPAWAYANPIPALAVLGRHALPFYLLHQPVILGVLEIVYSVR